MQNNIDQFIEAMRSNGLQPPPTICAGELHRFPGKGKGQGNKAAWARLFEDGRGGVYGDHSSGLKGHWQLNDGKEYSKEEQAAFVKCCEAERKQRDLEQQQRHEIAASKAIEILNAATADPAQHPYVLKKKVFLGEFLKRGSWAQRGWDDALLVPLYNAQGKVTTLSAINVDGEKNYLKGGFKKGSFYPFGKVRGANKILIGEGIATVAAVHEATHTPAAAAMDSGNLEAVALAMRELAPTAEIVFLADNDVSDNRANVGVEKAAEAAKKVHGFVAIPKLLNKAKCDFWDLWAQQGKDTVVKAVNEALNKAEIDTPHVVENNEGKENQASELVKFVLKQVELFHDKNSETYAYNLVTHATSKLDSQSFRRWLQASFHAAKNKVAREQSLREAVSTLSGLAEFNGPCREVYIRIAYEEAYFLDLAEPKQKRGVKITPRGWEITSDHDIRFLRSDTMRSLPEPKKGNMADFETFWDLVNIPEESHLLVITWLLEALRPNTPFPVLELLGEQGSAKSTTQAMLRGLIDPNTCDLRAAPKKEKDMFISANASLISSYENISHLSAGVQDALCVISTGGTTSSRKLYTDSGESVIYAKGPIVLNGISAAITAQDLIDRSISIELPIIRERQDVTQLWRCYEVKRADFLGALLTIFSKALAILPTVELPPKDRPRLIEFVSLGMAVAKAVGKSSDTFMEQFNSSRQESIARTIDASPAATALIEWFEVDRQGRTSVYPLKTIFAELEKKKPLYAENWPKTPKGLGDVLRRLAPALRQMGIECTSQGKNGRFVDWKIEGVQK